MRRLVTSAVCGALAILFTCGSLNAAPARRSRPGPRVATAGAPTPSPPPADASRPGEPNAEPGRRTAPRPQEYTLAEPSPAVKQQLKGLRTTGKILMYTGYGLSGFGLASTIVGAVLIAIHQGPKMQTIGIATLITGVATLAGGAALWGVGRWRMDQADLLLIRAQMRQVQLQDPAPPRSGSRALVLPTTHTIFSAQLRF